MKSITFSKRIYTQSIIFGGLILLLAILVLSLILIHPVRFIHQASSENAVSPGRTALLISLVSAVILMLILIVVYYRNAYMPLDQLVQKSDLLAKRDLAKMLNVVVGISQGDFTEHPDIQSVEIQARTSGGLMPVIRNMNRAIRYIREMADELTAMTGLTSLRLCFVGADSFFEGIKCGEFLGDAMGGKGQVMIIQGSLRHVAHSLRRKGFEHALREKYPEIEICDIFESKLNRDAVYSAMDAIVKKYPHLSGIYCTDTESVLGVVRFQEENPKTKNIKTMIHDLAATTVPHIRSGLIEAALNQNPISQGHDPVIYLFNHIAAGWQPPTPRLLLNLDVVTKDNLSEFWNDESGVILTENIKKSLKQPIKKSDKKLRIVVLGRAETLFWEPAKLGVELAAQTLEPFNARVEWICPVENSEQGDSSADVYGPWIERLIEEKCDGIAVVASDPNLVPTINKAVRSGIPVITWNSEPSNLGSLVYTVKDQSDKLMALSETLASSTYENNQATGRIKEAMNNLSASTVTQTDEVTRTQEVVNSLINNISYVGRESEISAKAGEDTVKTVDHSTLNLVKTLESIQNVGASVNQTGELVKELRKYSEEIDRVIDLINDIASRVNVLALNASIEATKAGDAGVGFRVVANEVRTLSNRTQDAVREVTEMIASFQTTIRSVEKNMKDNISIVKQTSSDTEKSRESIQKITDMVRTDQKRMENIRKLINETTDFSKRVDEAMQKLAGISRQNAGTVEEVNVSTEEMGTQLADIADMADLLQLMANGQLELLAKFQLKSG